MKTLKDRLQEGQQISKAVENTRRSEQKRHSKIKKRITFIIEQPFSYFITFTLTNDYLKLNFNTYTKKIRQSLKGSKLWIANSDYGSKNDRLHFHAVACYIDQLDYNTVLSVWQYGSVDFKPIIRKDEKSIREYILKTTNHALKLSVGRIIYGRLNINRKEVKTC